MTINIYINAYNKTKWKSRTIFSSNLFPHVHFTAFYVIEEKNDVNIEYFSNIPYSSVFHESLLQ